MPHVEGHLPDGEHAHPGLHVGEHSVCNQVDVATSPQEVPLRVEKDVPGEEDLRNESPWHSDNHEVKKPPEGQKTIPKCVRSSVKLPDVDLVLEVIIELLLDSLNIIVQLPDLLTVIAAPLVVVYPVSDCTLLFVNFV